MTVIAFDLDGTLSNPEKGIAASLNYALNKLGVPERNPDTLTRYIGPPLSSIFIDLLDTTDTATIQQAIGHYRDRYNSIGFRENVLFDGIRDVLEALVADNHRLYIATGKGPAVARAVVEYFELQQYFIDILGCGLQRKKHEVLEEILATERDRRLVMVGDRSHDTLAGKAVGARTIGVLWGFGSVQELQQSGAEILLDAPYQLPACLEAIAA